MAASICTSITGIRGWTYAVARVCNARNKETCTQICESDKLRSQDRQTANRGGGLQLHCTCTEIIHQALPVPSLSLTLASKFFNIRTLIVLVVVLTSAAVMCQCKDPICNH